MSNAIVSRVILFLLSLFFYWHFQLMIRWSWWIFSKGRSSTIPYASSGWNGRWLEWTGSKPVIFQFSYQIGDDINYWTCANSNGVLAKISKNWDFIKMGIPANSHLAQLCSKCYYPNRNVVFQEPIAWKMPSCERSVHTFHSGKWWNPAIFSENVFNSLQFHTCLRPEKMAGGVMKVRWF